TSNQQVFDPPLAPYLEPAADGADLSIQLHHGTANAFESATHAYSVTVTNEGMVDVTDAAVAVSFPKTYDRYMLTEMTFSMGVSSATVVGAVLADFATTVSLPTGGVATFEFTLVVGDAFRSDRAASSIDQAIASVTVPIGLGGDVNPNDNRRTDSVLSFLQSKGGTQQFSAAETEQPEFQGQGFAFGDVNGDSERDLVAADRDLGVRVFLRGPDGYNLAYSFAESAEMVQLADLDNDQDLDLISAIGNTLTIRKNMSGDSFGAAATMNVSTGIGKIVVADFTGDGFVDVITLSESLSNRVLVNQGDGTFANTGVLGVNGRGVGVGDFDGDGDLDLLYVGSGIMQVAYNGNLDLVVRWQADRAAVEPGATIPVQLSVRNTLGTMTVDDGRVVVDVSGAAGELRLLSVEAEGGAQSSALPGDVPPGGEFSFALPSGTELRFLMQLTIPEQLPPNLTNTPFAELPATIDFREQSLDGSPQTNHSSLFLTVARASLPESGLFVRSATIGTSAETIDVGDIDGDGDMDLFLSGISGVDLWVIDGGQFTLATDWNDAPAFGDIALGDLDRDGDLDLVSVRGSDASIMLNDGTGYFEWNSVVEAGLSGFSHTSIIDVDGDGDFDIYFSAASFNLWYNDGALTFTHRVAYNQRVTRRLG
ncbi:MAG: VCBS repeat-containing protein, partial [Planctomycetales bacterium]|nr:VCBS repeat-containing protein [Planctomycetales bacterium]